MRILVIVNGKHALGAIPEKLLYALEQEASISVNLKETRHSKHAISLVEAFGSDADVILGVGGDGTFHEIINAHQQHNLNAAIGFIPNGTGNDFVKMFKPIEIKLFIERLRSNETTKIDVGLLSGQEEERYFINIAGIGIDGRVIELMERSGNKSKLTYAKAIVKAFLSFKKPVVKIKGDDFEYEGPIMMLAMCNGRVFGNGLTIAPQASLKDGQFNITLLGSITLLDYVLNLTKLKKARLIKHKQVSYHKTTRLKVVTIEGNTIGEADGESFKMKSFELHVLPEKIRVINELN